MTAWVPFAALGLAGAALSLALMVAVRNRSLFNPRLDFQFRLFLWVSRKRLPSLRHDPAALFVIGETQAPDSIHLPLHLKNRSRRKITDITIELTYPRPFFVSNRRHSELFDMMLTHFPEREDEIAIFRRLLAQRTVSPNEDIVVVTYSLGTLLPGQSVAFTELLDVPARDLSFADVRFEKRMFAKILERLRTLKFIRGVCHIEGTVYSDLNEPIKKWINLVSAKAKMSETLWDDLTAQYALAHWLGKLPSGNFFRPPVPFPRAYRQPLNRRCYFDVMSPEIVIERRVVKDGIVIAPRVDEKQTTHGHGYMLLPGYDYFRLPENTSHEHALLSIGFGKPHEMIARGIKRKLRERAKRG